jgi:predicted metalloendopeptidase
VIQRSGLVPALLIILYQYLTLELVVSCQKRYPDKWVDYGPLKIEEGDAFLDMVFKAREFDNSLDNKEMNAPTDREKWVRRTNRN